MLEFRRQRKAPQKKWSEKEAMFTKDERFKTIDVKQFEKRKKAKLSSGNNDSDDAESFVKLNKILKLDNKSKSSNKRNPRVNVNHIRNKKRNN